MFRQIMKIVNAYILTNSHPIALPEFKIVSGLNNLSLGSAIMNKITYY